jgi:hypothetical protein
MISPHSEDAEKAVLGANYKGGYKWKNFIN